ncbi:MAG: hypothetical protein LUE08_01675 [Akkermansiaceae bacterium]|nr:hypothetical protein [Akkermansiaceae bacterium]
MNGPFTMRLSTILKKPPAWLADFGDSEDVVIASIAEYKRNLEEAPFPGWADEKQRQDVFLKIRGAVEKLACFRKGHFAEMPSCTLDARRLLTEWQMLTPTLAARQEGCGFALSRDRGAAVFINDEEHLAVRAYEHGMQIDKAAGNAHRILEELSGSLSFARDERLGYLMSSPACAGAGFRLSVLLHLPGLTIADMIAPVMNSAESLSISIRPVYREENGAAGHLYEVSSVSPFDEKESEITDRMARVVSTLAERELSVRCKFVESHFYDILDPVERSVGTLHYAVRLGWRETMTALSFIRMGTFFDMINWSAGNRKQAVLSLPALSHTISSSFLNLHRDPSLQETDNVDVLRSFRVRKLLYPAIPFGVTLDEP